MGMAQVSTTFLTGTLTGLVSSLVSPGQDTPHGLRRFGVLIGLAAGATLGGLLIATAARAVPALLLAAPVTTLVLAADPAWLAPLAQREHDGGPLRGVGARVLTGDDVSPAGMSPRGVSMSL